MPDTFTAATIDEMTRQIQEKVYNKYGIAIATVGVYSMNTTDDKALRIKSDITRLVMSEEFVLQMHGFYLDEEKMLMLFDIIVDFDAPDRMQVRDNILDKIKYFSRYFCCPSLPRLIVLYFFFNLGLNVFSFLILHLTLPICKTVGRDFICSIASKSNK